ncbi:hypothetical protein Q5752_003023 [Cryptotrichosporon argae]
MVQAPIELGAPIGAGSAASGTSIASTSATAATADARPAGPPPAKLEHTRTAPTTVPVAAVAQQPQTAPTDADDADGGSSERTLADAPVPASFGGNHGEPLPGSKHALGTVGEKDHQAGTAGRAGGSALGDRARAELDEKGGYAAAAGVADSSSGVIDVKRTASGTHVPSTRALVGGPPVPARGMQTLQRKPSRPPAVSPFGGVAPDGEDAEEGLMAVRSREEEDAREAERAAKGPDPWAVRFEPGEKANPKNWGVNYRWYLTSLGGLLVLNSTFASSAPSGIATEMATTFGFGQEVAILTISLFVAGYCVGPLLWGPLSEVYGRRPIFIIAFVVYTGMQVGCALSPNTAAILVFRFLGGIFAASPLTNSGALLADIWDGDHRGQAMSIFSLAPFAGPSIGPIVSGYIEVAGVDWRWVYWILTMFAGACLALIVFTLPETYAPVLLAQKARRMRKETGDERWYAPIERVKHSFKSRLRDILLKPFIILFLEPMLLAVTIYMSFVYGVVYLLFEAYPFVFIQNHGFNQGEDGLAFLGFFLGGFIAVIFFLVVIEPRYQRHAKQVAPKPPSPEKRLEMCVISGWALVIAMFWFAWTSYPSIHWISCVLAGGLIGVGVLGMFVSLFNYIIDVYLWAAASALAATTVFRSLFGAGFPLFAVQMYEKLGTHWASSLLGFIALLLAPIPMVLIKFGPKLRARSRFSPNKA